MEDWDTQAIIGEALKQIDRECQQHPQKSYFALVPPRLQPAIEKLVRANYAYYAPQFGKDRVAFRDQMARNWLVKRKAFAALAVRARLRPVPRVGAGHGPPRPNEASFAILTLNSSYLLVGPGAFDPKGPGASYRYRRIPLREAERVPNMEGPAGLYFRKPPSTNKRANTSKVNTSPVVSLFTGAFEPEEARNVAADLDATLGQTFTYTDTLTLHPRPAPASDGQ
jgi:hypothetical protein